jgi:hypothetical protein
MKKRGVGGKPLEGFKQKSNRPGLLLEPFCQPWFIF